MAATLRRLSAGVRLPACRAEQRRQRRRRRRRGRRYHRHCAFGCVVAVLLVSSSFRKLLYVQAHSLLGAAAALPERAPKRERAEIVAYAQRERLRKEFEFLCELAFIFISIWILILIFIFSALRYVIYMSP